MDVTNADLVLDGNAVAGVLAEIFGEDLTAMLGTCPDCGRRAELAACRAYTHAPGIVLRCSACDGVQLRIARTPRGYRYEARVQVEGRFPASG
ncbi:MAG TPA: DUF6510 family protein [Patescibacteria group bacterium]|nr:DUF6510 family protein [Patescibacteria group bacterium]